MDIVKYKNQSGVTYAYESISEWVDVRQRRKMTPNPGGPKGDQAVLKEAKTSQSSKATDKSLIYSEYFGDFYRFRGSLRIKRAG